MRWQDQINDILAEIHPVEIEGVIKTAIGQILLDYKDYLTIELLDPEQIRLHEELIKKWTDIFEKIEEE